MDCRFFRSTLQHGNDEKIKEFLFLIPIDNFFSDRYDLKVVQKFLSKSVEYKDGKIYRHVNDMSACSYILKMLKKLNMLGVDVVSTSVSSKNVLEHEILLPIIYSGEYTVSMAYDVTEKALNISIKLLDEKIYSWDTLPHNFSYHKGHWILHDFDALDIKSDNVKTFVRNMFKISFVSFELLLRGISRADLKHFFLNRTPISDIPHILPPLRAVRFLILYRFCMTLAHLWLYKFVYRILYKLFLSYKKEHIRHYYVPNSDNTGEFEIINKIIPKSGRIFGVGKYFADWSLYNTNENTDKFVYFEDYELCNRFYNSVYGKRENIYTAALCPCAADNRENEHYGSRYSALYDNFNKLRFTSDCAVVEFEEINADINCLETLFDFIDKGGAIIVIFSKILYKEYADKLNFEKYFEKTEIYETEYKIILYAYSKYEIFPRLDVNYGNENRMRDAKIHGENIKKIVKKDA